MRKTSRARIIETVMRLMDTVLIMRGGDLSGEREEGRCGEIEEYIGRRI